MSGTDADGPLDPVVHLPAGTDHAENDLWAGGVGPRPSAIVDHDRPLAVDQASEVGGLGIGERSDGADGVRHGVRMAAPRAVLRAAARSLEQATAARADMLHGHQSSGWAQLHPLTIDSEDDDDDD